MKETLIAFLISGSVVFAVATILFARPCGPGLPVEASFRNARWVPGQVMQIHNESGSVRKMRVVIRPENRN